MRPRTIAIPAFILAAALSVSGCMTVGPTLAAAGLAVHSAASATGRAIGSVFHHDDDQQAKAKPAQGA
jgi:hypothetical protein